MEVEAILQKIAASAVAPARRREGLETVCKLLTNLRNSPTQEKYRVLKKSNPAIQSRLFPECWDLLLAAGFEDNGDILQFRKDVNDSFMQAIALIECILLSLPAETSAAKAPAVSASSTTGTSSSSTARASRVERQQQEMRKAQATAQEQLAALRQNQASRYQSQQDSALAQHLSRVADDSSFDAIAALNAARGAVYSFVTCNRCSAALRYSSSTSTQAVLCPCGNLLQPIHLQGQRFAPRSPSELPVAPGEPVDRDNRPRGIGGPFVSVRSSSGEISRLPLYSVLQMARQAEQNRTIGAEDETIDALPTRTFHAAAAKDEEDLRCQICMEDFEEGSELRTLPCFHLFHSACVDQWLKVNSICPTCRHKVG